MAHPLYLCSETALCLECSGLGGAGMVKLGTAVDGRDIWHADESRPMPECVSEITWEEAETLCPTLMRHQWAGGEPCPLEPLPEAPEL